MRIRQSQLRLFSNDVQQFSIDEHWLHMRLCMRIVGACRISSTDCKYSMTYCELLLEHCTGVEISIRNINLSYAHVTGTLRIITVTSPRHCTCAACIV